MAQKNLAQKNLAQKNLAQHNKSKSNKPFGSGTSATTVSPLKGANVLVLDGHAPTAQLLRSHIEDRGAASVEIAINEDEALDILGSVPRPVLLAMMDTLTDGAACVAVLRVLCKHRARIYVTLHGRHAPEQYAVPRNLVGAAAYIHQATAAKAIETAEAVINQGLTVHKIIDDRIVPATLDREAARAIYGAPPGQPFPITLRP